VNSYLKKGRKVLVVGRLQTRNWDAEDGSKRNRTEIVATDINFVGGQNDNTDFGADDMNQEAPAPKASKKDDSAMDDLGEGEINLDDIPF